MKKRRWCAWDSIPGHHNGRRNRIHWAMGATPGTEFFTKAVEMWSSSLFARSWRRNSIETNFLFFVFLLIYLFTFYRNDDLARRPVTMIFQRRRRRRLAHSRNEHSLFRRANSFRVVVVINVIGVGNVIKFGEILPLLPNILLLWQKFGRFNLVFGKILNLLWHKFYAIVENFIVVNGQILDSYLAILSLCRPVGWNPGQNFPGTKIDLDLEFRRVRMGRCDEGQNVIFDSETVKLTLMKKTLSPPVSEELKLF